MRISIILALLATLALAVPQLRGCQIVPKVTLTFFGIPDNDDNADIAFDCGRGHTAGGIGTFRDPVTFASAPGEFRKCEVIYAPYLRKYLRHEDTCPECVVEWHTRIRHVDVWVGSSRVSGGADQIDCENRLAPSPRSQSIIRNPSSNLTVDAFPLFVPNHNRSSCNLGHVFPSNNPRDLC